MNNYVFTFYIDPKLNCGGVEAFNQSGEPWFWAVDSAGEMLGAGDVDFTGARFKGFSCCEGGVTTCLVGEQ